MRKIMSFAEYCKISGLFFIPEFELAGFLSAYLEELVSAIADLNEEQTASLEHDMYALLSKYMDGCEND